MVWARFDDGYSECEKVLAAGAMAELLDMRAIIYCARNETDGRISRIALKRIAHGIPAVEKKVAVLVEVGRWDEHPNGGWLVHDFLKYNPSKVQIAAQREKGKQRQREHRSRRDASVTDALGSTGRDGNLSTEEKTSEIAVKPPWSGSGENPVDFAKRLAEKQAGTA